jgi:RNA polymerase sigma factor (TIGR02999 family)
MTCREGLPVGEDPGAITVLLNRAAAGDSEAGRAAFDAIYAELRRIASARAARMPHGATLATTALVHEAYLRVVGRNPEGWQSARHFYFTAARAMRDILVEDARRKGSQKRGAGRERVTLDEVAATTDRPAEEILALDRALEKLRGEDADGHQLLMLRFFAGLTVEEAAEALEVSVRTLHRKWQFLRVWLARELELPVT